jgi:hypothetical protein
MATDHPQRTTIARPAGRYAGAPLHRVKDPDLPWVVGTLVVIGGYMTFQRPFAYLGIPGLPLFIGELLLVAFFVFRSEHAGHRLVDSLLRPGPLGAVAWSITLLIIYGLMLAVRGEIAGFPRQLVAQELAFNVYPLYVFLGLWLGERDPRLLERFLLIMSWVIGIYGIVYMTYLNHTIVAIPGTDIVIFRSPLAQGAILLALLAFRVKGYRLVIPFLLNLLVLMGIQNRAAYAGFAVGLVVWAVMAKRVGKMLAVVAVVTMLMAVAWVLDVRVEFSRGASEYSARNVVAAVIAPFDEAAAAQYSDDARNFAGTTEWRKDWWAGIWDGVHADPIRTAFGPGYGFQLTSDAHLRSSEDDLRTPHNWFMYALGYGGWTHAVLFVFLLGSLSILLWRAFRLTGIAFGLPYLAFSTTVGTFSNFYETPFAAIPVWVIVGMAIAPAIRERWMSPPDAGVRAVGAEVR